MKSIVMIIVSMVFVGCALDNKKVDVYILGGQSNASQLWYEEIKAHLPPDSIVIYQNHTGEPIQNWFNNGTAQKNYYYDLKNIKTNLPSIYNIKGFYWFQGEANYKYYSSDDYEANLLGIINSFERDLNDTFLTHMFIVNSDVYNVEKIRTVQRGIVKKYNNITGFDTIRYERYDMWHLTDDATKKLVNDFFSR